MNQTEVTNFSRLVEAHRNYTESHTYGYRYGYGFKSEGYPNRLYYNRSPETGRINASVNVTTGAAENFTAMHTLNKSGEVNDVTEIQYENGNTYRTTGGFGTYLGIGSGFLTASEERLLFTLRAADWEVTNINTSGETTTYRLNATANNTRLREEGMTSEDPFVKAYLTNATGTMIVTEDGLIKRSGVIYGMKRAGRSNGIYGAAGIYSPEVESVEEPQWAGDIPEFNISIDNETGLTKYTYEKGPALEKGKNATIQISILLYEISLPARMEPGDTLYVYLPNMVGGPGPQYTVNERPEKPDDVYIPEAAGINIKIGETRVDALYPGENTTEE